jgi:hypothetical protein
MSTIHYESPTAPPSASVPAPAPGQVVGCRTRTWLVESVERSLHGAEVALACLDDDAEGDELEVIWELELDTEILDREAWKSIGRKGFDDPRHIAAPPTACGFALAWLDLADEELADTLAGAPDDTRERIESADYFFPDAASACRFQSHIEKGGTGKLPWRYRWPDDTRDDILARLLALNAQRAELERLTGLPTATPKAKGAPDSDDANGGAPAAPKAKRAKKASKRASKKSAPRPMFDE